jgi:protein SCO1/2
VVVLTAVGCAAALLVSCGSAPVAVSTQSARPAPSNGTTFDVAVPASTASLPLVDQSGRSVTLGSLVGKTVVLVDFLTLCQEICPLTSANMSRVASAVDRAGLAGEVTIAEVTVDPERDDVAHLGAYQKLFGARPGWQFLTGKPADVAALWKSFGVATERKPLSDSPGSHDWLTGTALTYDVDHQDVVIVIGPDGHERWLVNGTPSVSAPTSVPSTLQSFLSDEGLANESAPQDPSWTAADVEEAITYVTGHRVG